MTDKIDLHTHSTRSDGTNTPAEVARLAYEAGLKAAALTDHDTTDGTEEFCAECEKLGIEGISGVEIGTKYKRELHIVGLYAKGQEFEEVISKLRDGRKIRNEQMLDKLCENGYIITKDDIIDAQTGADMQSVGRVHMANALVRKGYAKDRNDAFDRLIAKGRPCYVSRFALTPEESVRFIKRCGGAAIWAHPVYTADSEEELKEIATRLKEAGLDAMECYYSRYTDEQTQMCIRIAEETGLLMSGGSDYHGENKPDVMIGRVNGGYVPYELLEKIKERIR